MRQRNPRTGRFQRKTVNEIAEEDQEEDAEINEDDMNNVVKHICARTILHLINGTYV